MGSHKKKQTNEKGSREIADKTDDRAGNTFVRSKSNLACGACGVYVQQLLFKILVS